MKKISEFLMQCDKDYAQARANHSEKSAKIIYYLSKWYKSKKSSMFIIKTKLEINRRPSIKEIKECIDEIEEKKDISDKDKKEVISLIKTLTTLG